jgi:hypothetical protein
MYEIIIPLGSGCLVGQKEVNKGCTGNQHGPQNEKGKGAAVRCVATFEIAI